MPTSVARNLSKTVLVAIICGAVILFMSLGIRHAFGLFLKPVTIDMKWGRESFALTIALQNLAWGFFQPITGMLADRFGSTKVILAGGVLYALGLYGMSISPNELWFGITGGLIIGLAQSGTTFPVVFGAVSRLVAPEKRSLAMGITMSVGSFGQFVMLPVSLGLIGWVNWQGALVALSIISLTLIPLAFGIADQNSPAAQSKHSSVGEALKEAFGSRDFWLLGMGFFACGFQVVLIAVHLPAFLADNGVDSTVSTTVLALIGLFNIAGTYYAGLWGGRYNKPTLLVWVYIARAAIIALFITLPITVFSSYVFGVLMGLFWLSTVPLTNGTVATRWGVQHMSMLGGFVFFVHQIGGFLGGWLGGWLYDHTGSYNVAWAIAIALSLVAAILNWPIREQLPLAAKVAT
jgi:MFS family permease